MSTDGFADQFGTNGRRFGSRQLGNLLKENSIKPFDEQKEIIISAFNEHKGESERIDDVTVAGFGF